MRSFKPFFCSAFVFGLFSLVFASIGAPPAHASVACSASAPAQNGIKVSPSHGSAFYIDTGVTPKLDAGYIGYRVNNTSTSTQSHLWVQVSSFTGGSLGLANSNDSIMQVPSLAPSTTGTAYFLLKATGASTSPQAHTVRVYSDRPDLASATLLYDCTFTFTKVQETIKAAANKVTNNGLNTAAAIEVSDTTPELGQTVTISVEGETGQIGAGSSPDFDIVWLTPAAISSWPTRELRLESVSVTFDANKNWATTNDEVTYNDQLLISSVDGSTVDGSAYRAFYTFRVIGKPASTVKVVPIAQISSGTQVKHTDTTAAGATLDLSFASLAINASLTKDVTATTSLQVVTCGPSCSVPNGVNGRTYVAVPYLLHATASTLTTVTMDEFVDTPSSTAIFKPGSATITDIGRTTSTISDPVYLSSEASLVPRPYHFVGPFTLNSATSAYLAYTMWVSPGSSINTTYGKLGDVLIGATASSMSMVTVTSNGTATITAVTSTTALPVDVITDPATNVTTTSATLNGTVDPNGVTPLTGTFQYGTSASLIGAASVTATTPTSGILGLLTDPTSISVDISGLTPATTYYYRAVAGSASGTIMSFTTQSLVATPTVTTLAATNVALTTSTLNGTINPNLTPITAVQFIYATNPTFTLNAVTSTLDDGTGLAAMTLGGSSAQAMTLDVSGLTPGRTYYYKLRACTGTLSGTYPNVNCASYVDDSVVSFFTAIAPAATTMPATFVGASSATLNGSVNADYATTTASFIYGTVADLSSATSSASAGTVTGGASTPVSASIAGLSPATTYYFKVVGTNTVGTVSGSILSFTTSSTNRTLTIDGSSYTATYVATSTPPTLTATPSAGTGTLTFTSVTPSVCTVNAATGAVTFVSVGTCTIYAVISSSGSYSDATSPSISFTITAASRTLAIDPASYTSSYSILSVPPTLTATPSAGTGTITFTASSPSVCTVDSSTGAVTFVTTGTCQIGATITANGLYGSATATDISFTITASAIPPTVTTDAASAVSTSTATLGGSITATGGATSTSRGFEYGVTASYGATTTLAGSFGITSFSDNVSGLSPATTYHYRAYAVNSQGIAYGSDATFTTDPLSRTLTIDPASYTSSYTLAAVPPTLTATPSAGTGTITFTESSPSVCTVNSSTGVVSFVTTGTCQIGATISANGSYATATASVISFSITVAAVRPTVTTDAASSVSTSTATLGGSITATGGATSTSRGFEYGVTTSYGATTTVAGSFGVTSFSDPVSGLTPATTYHYRAYAVNSQGIAYGSDATFTTSPVSRTLAIDGSSYTATYTFTTPPPTLTATPSAGTGTISFTESSPSICTVNSSTGAVTFVTTGTCQIGATITANGIYATATASTISFTITASPRTLTIDGASYTSSYVASVTPPTLTATPSAGTGTRAFTSLTTGICTVNAATGAVTFVGIGTCSIYATITANGSYAGATAATISFSVTPIVRTLSIDPASYASQYLMSAAPPTLTATPSAGSGTITFAGRTPDACTVDAATGAVTFVRNGLCQADATISTSGLYNSATAAVISFTISTATPQPAGGGSPSTPTTPTTPTSPTSPTTPNSPAAPAPTTLPTGTTQPAPVTTPAQTANASARTGNTCAVDCKALSWDVFIVNPDGTERHVGTKYVQTEKQTDGRTLLKFEDSGKDFDYNDVWVMVDDRVCGNWKFDVTQKMAKWNHRIMLRVLHRGSVIDTRVLWQNSSQAVGNSQIVDASTLRDVCLVPKAPECSRIGIAPFIINPNGTVRRTKTKFVRETALSLTLTRYGFEDKGDDFDYNDVVVDVNHADCSKVVMTNQPESASWHHQILATLSLDGKAVKDVMVWPDSKLSNGASYTFDAASMLGMKAVKYVAASSGAACSSNGIHSGMRPGTTGSDVAALQGFLKCAGFLDKSIVSNAVYGPSTTKAVQDFQKSRNLEPVGYIGTGTMDAIRTFSK